ncbi:MAG: hypothetical protein B5M49_00955 [Thermotoga sp. 4484_232]|nr:MAG: hypothetical protein B5M49_00955 [Thermotoga sp. 4484_232]
MLRSMSLFSIGMLLQFRMRDVGASLFMIGLLSTVRGGIRTLSSPFWGYMSDRLMKRKVFLVSSLALTSSLYPLYIVVENPVRIILIASLIAFVSAGFEPSALAFAGEGRKKAYVGFSIYNSSISLGFLFGRILMGVLLMTFDIKTSMVLFSVIMALAVIPSLQIPENLKTIEKSVNVSRKEVLLKDGLWAMYVGSFLRQMGVSGTLAVIAIYIEMGTGIRIRFLGNGVRCFYKWCHEFHKQKESTLYESEFNGTFELCKIAGNVCWAVLCRFAGRKVLLHHVPFHESHNDFGSCSGWHCYEGIKEVKTWRCSEEKPSMYQGQRIWGYLFMMMRFT